MLKRTIVIAGHESGDLQRLRQILELQDYKIIQVASGEEAIAVARGTSIDAFLIDIETTDGCDLGRALRGLEKYGRTPIIFLAAPDDEAILQKALANGDDFIVKPCSPLAVRVRLKTNLERAD